MVRLTDSSLTLRISGVDLTRSDPVIVTLSQLSTLIEAANVTVADAGTLLVNLTQQETGRLQPGSARIQVNGVRDGKRWATEAAKIELTENLLGRVLETSGVAE